MKQLPKIELHCHLDGSLRVETVKELGIQYNVELPTDNCDLLKDYLKAPLECDSLSTYLNKFDLPISVMQSKQALSRCAYELVEDYALENTKYLEIRFNPYAHTKGGLTLKEVIASVIEGTNKGQGDYDLKVNVILSFNRGQKTHDIYKLIEEGKEFIGKGVVAIDLCGEERESFVRKYIKPIKVAREVGFKVTIHAGETGYPKNVIEAIEYLDARRIGHGVAIIHDAPCLEYVTSSNVLLEVCPTSNIQTKAFASYQDHPVDEFLKRGINLSIGTDNRTVSNISLSDEYTILEKTFGWSQSEFAKVYNMSIDASFARTKTKEWLREVGKDFYKDNF